MTRHLSTRFLLTCAAIGAAGAVLIVPATNVAVSLGHALPFLYASISGVWILPSVVGLALLRRSGSGVLTAAMSGLITVPLNPTGASAFLTSLVVGVILELFFAVTLYRIWSRWLFLLACLGIAMIFIPTVWGFYELDTWTVWGAAAIAALIVVSCVTFTFIGLILAKRVEATGVVRGVTRSTQPSQK